MPDRQLLVLLGCVFVVMIGLGVILPVLPFYVERLAGAEGASQSVPMHVGWLTGVYSLAQLFFAPVWGRLSDRMGRRLPLLIGIAGYALAQVLFGLATSLWLLYVARTLGGILSAAALPVAAAYIADVTTDEERGQGMAWLGAAVSLGFVVGPALGGLLSGRDVHVGVRYWHFLIDGFSIPFFVAAALGLLALFSAIRWLEEPRTGHAPDAQGQETRTDWRWVVRGLGPPLGLTLVGQGAHALFEGTFALYAMAALDYGPAEVGAIFVVCGLVMAVFQPWTAGALAGRVGEVDRIGVGFGVMGASLTLLAVARGFFVFAIVGLYALGMAFVSPNLAALISKRGGPRRSGAALGAQNAANSLGQAGGVLLGTALFAWKITSPYLITGGLLLSVALVVGARRRGTRDTVRGA